jgi:hypothetical protein
MKLIKILGLVGAMMLSYWPTATMAAVATASAAIDWSTILSPTLSPGMSLIWTPYFGDDTNATASQSSPSMSGYDEFEAGNWVGIASDVMLGQAQGYGTTTANLVDADALLSTSPGVSAGAEGEAFRWGLFTVTGSGSVTFNVNYTGQLNTSGNSSNEAVWAIAGSYLNLFNLNGGSTSNTSAFGQLFSDGALNAPSTLFVTLLFNDGDTGLINAGTYAQVSTSISAVPVPPALWLIASALVSLGVIGRRKSDAYT